MSRLSAISSPHLALLLERGFDALCRRDPAGVRCMDAAGRVHGEAACRAAGTSLATAGDGNGRFTLMSAVKPFLLLRLLEYYGPETVAGWVGDEPSALPYYSMEQLSQDGGRPRNAMINSGAMLLASKLPGGNPEEQEFQFVRWLSALAPEAGFSLDAACYSEVMEQGTDPDNRALAEALKQAGGVDSAEEAYDIYFRLCCLSGTIQDAARLGHALACGASPWKSQVLRTMSRCGLYEASAAWWAATGLPAKSGVSGVMLGVWPGEGCVAVGSPWLDAGGNPIIPQAVLAALARECPPAPFSES